MRNLLRIIYEPDRVFGEEQNPWIPLLAGMILSLLFFVGTQFLLKQEILSSAMERIADLPEEQKSRVLNLLYSSRRILFGALTLMIGYPLKVALLALIYNIATPIFGGELSYLRAFTIFSFSSYVSSLSAIVKFPISIISRNPVVRMDLGLFFAERTNYAAIITSQIDLFTIWSLLIAVVGLEKYSKMRRENAFALVAILWFAYVLVIYPLLMLRRFK